MFLNPSPPTESLEEGGTIKFDSAPVHRVLEKTMFWHESPNKEKAILLPVWVFSKKELYKQLTEISMGNTTLDEL